MTSKKTRYETVGAALGRFATLRAKLAIALSLLAFVVAAAGLPRARFSTDYRIFFSKEDPGLATFDRLEKVFTKTDNILFVVHAREGSIVTADGLQAIEELTDEAWKLPFSSRVDSLTNFPVIDVGSGGDDLVQRPLVPSPAAATTVLAQAGIRERALSEPLLVGGLIAKDGRTGAVNVTLRLPNKSADEVSIAAEAARQLVRRIAARHPALEIRPCGMAFMNDALMQASISDLGVLVPLMIVVMLAAMMLLLRSLAATLAVGVVIALSSSLAMAFAGWAGYPLTPPAVAAPMMVLTVAVADGVHVVLATMEGLRDGLRKPQAIVHALSSNLEAITYTWLTTIVGFLCLNYSEAPPVRHLANMTSAGVTAAFLFSITLLPALLAVLPLRAHAHEIATSASRQRSGRAFTDWLATFVVAHRNAVLAIAALVTVSSGVLASRLETNDQFVRYFGKSTEFRRDVDFTMQNLSGIYRLEYQVGSGGPGAITEPWYLERLDAFAGWLRTQPEVDHVHALTDVLKRVHQANAGGAAAGYALASSKAEASEELFVYEMGLPSGLDLRDRIDVDKSTTRVSVTVKDMSTREMTAFKTRSANWLRDHAPAAMAAEATGPVVIFSELSDRNARSMVQGDFVSLALISLCMMIVLRSARLGLLSVIPNVVPIVIGYGVWRLAVGEMNIVASVAGSISLGVIVDDTIHFLTRFKAVSANEPGLDPAAAMRKTLQHVAPAMLSTSGILALGFGVLTLSNFQMVSHLGWLSLLVVAIAPIADLVIVPALVLALAPSAKKRAATNATDSGATLVDIQHAKVGAA